VSYYHLWGRPAKTSGWQNYPNGWVYTGGIGMPTARLDFNGSRPIRIHSFGDYYVTGAGSFMRMNYLGNLLHPGESAVYGVSGGSFQWEAHQGNVSNPMYFGRDEGAGRSVISAQGGSWAGTLAGSFYWDQVPSSPSFLEFDVEPGLIAVLVSDPDNGGTYITYRSMRYRRNGGGWSVQVNQTDQWFVFDDLAPGNYEFQTWAHNDVGASQLSQSGVVSLRAGGRRRASSSWVDNQTTRRYNGTSWTDLNTKKRWNGSAFVDLSI
jgi:hypothetical protein